MTVLHIVRGWPGSGKSTLARKLATQLKIFDIFDEHDYFIFSNQGVWDRTKLSEARRHLKQNVIVSMASKRPIIVSGCFIHKKELSEIELIAKGMGYGVAYHVASGDFKSPHDYPDDLVALMKKNFEK